MLTMQRAPFQWARHPTVLAAETTARLPLFSGSLAPAGLECRLHRSGALQDCWAANVPR